MADAILALNAGSSSIKFALYAASDSARPAMMLHGQVEGIGLAPHLIAHDPAGEMLADKRWPDGATDHGFILDELLAWVEAHLGTDPLAAVGHRVVHGGRDFTSPSRLTEGVVAALDQLTPLAPLHQPHSLAPIRTIMALRPDMAQVACFDTAFHHTLPPVATRFALPAPTRTRECAATAFMAFHTSTSPAPCVTRRPTSPAGASWSPTSATAPAFAPCGTALASTPPWASPLSTAW